MKGTRENHDGRFAPSPTGPLHLGNLRTALLAWLFARSQGGRFLLRMEDLDRRRVRPGAEKSQLQDLRSLGLDWDGPVVRQSERLHLYEEALTSLTSSGMTYPCYCTRAEIQAAASAPHGASPLYPGTCRHLSARQRALHEASGRPPALRLAAGGATLGFEDRIKGYSEHELDDFVIRRNDGTPAYQLAVTVDDARQGIGEVVRGDDLLGSTPRQLFLARLLGLPEPRYAHVPLVLGPDKERLAKRHGPVTLSGNSEDALAWMARSLGLAKTSEHPTLSLLLSRFDPDDIPPSPAIWDGETHPG